MANDGKFLIYINQRYYWDLNLIPEMNEFDEPVNRCALVDSESKEEIDAIDFDATWLVPIFQCRSQIGMKELATKLKEVTDKHKIQMTPRTQMPQDKRIKETKHVGKVRKI
jgi:hypothetical protein